MMKILVACEESQVVCKAFRAKGHEAYSCDIQDCSGDKPEWHYKRDVFDVISLGWDLMIAHPPCTYLCNSGVHWLHKQEGRFQKMADGASFFNYLLNTNCIDKIAVENPIPHKYAVEIMGRKYDQIVQPWMFGHTERKATCLWLKGLPKLTETNNVKEEMFKLPKREQQKLHYLPPSKDRAKLRSKTYQGIADAMSEQWGTP
jgi:hypothetical protein